MRIVPFLALAFVVFTSAGANQSDGISVTVIQEDGTPKMGGLRYVEPAEALPTRSHNTLSLRSHFLGLEAFVVWPVCGFVGAVNSVMALCEDDLEHALWSTSLLYLTARGWRSMTEKFLTTGDFELVDSSGNSLKSDLGLNPKQVAVLYDLAVRRAAGWKLDGESVSPDHIFIKQESAHFSKILIRALRSKPSYENEAVSPPAELADINRLSRGSMCQQALLRVLDSALVTYILITP